MNKMFKKIFAVVAACATVATMSVSAFAATANHEDGTVSVSGYEAVTGATQYTVMVFKVAEGTTDLAKAAPSEVGDIYYINQGTELYDEVDKDGLLDKMLVKATDGENALPAGNYAVRIGNDANEVVTLGLAVTADVTFMYGDVNGDSSVDIMDALEIINYVLWEPSALDDEAEWRFKAANITADRETDESVDIMDALEIINYVLWEPSTLDTLLPAE